MWRYLLLPAFALIAAASAWLIVGNGSDRDGVVAQPIGEFLQDMGPGTTLHTVDLQYRRYGPAEAVIPKDGDYRPEETHVESWMTFDETGALSSLRSETRGLDGTVYAVTRSDGEDLVYESGDGVERTRLPGHLAGLTVDILRAALSQAYAEGIVAMEEQTDARRETLRSQAVQVLEHRRPFTREVVTAVSGPDGDGRTRRAYSIPYVGDLAPVEEIRRQYMWLDENREIRYEVVVVDAAGTETVVESTDQLVLEILTP